MFYLHLLLPGLIFLLPLCVWTWLFIGVRRIRRLRDVLTPEELAWPQVSIIVPARNEERDIEEALQSVLALDYPDYEILVVNDRSTDGTGAILARMQETYPRLNVATVTELPPGWLGKNHALYYGAERAQGEILLFTDADIVMRPDTLRRAVYYLEREKIDHLAMSCDVDMPTWLLESFVVIFVILFTIFTRTWSVRNPKSSAHVGIGAFNMIRAEAYRAVGTHRVIAMRPDDDLKLGKLVKLHGRVQDFLNASDFLRVRWYRSLNELIQGLMKNMFSGSEYNVPFTLFSGSLMILVHVWPFLAVWITSGPVQWLYAATIAMHMLAYSATAWELKARWWGVFAYPLVFALFVYIQFRAMFLTFYNNGIYWRETHYTLAELKANKI